MGRIPRLGAHTQRPVCRATTPKNQSILIHQSGLPPNDPNDPGYSTDYSSPAIRYADGSYEMDSWHIIQKLEKQYPTPSLHLDDPIVEKLRTITIVKPLVPHLIPKVPRLLLSKVSADYFYLTREEAFGKPLEQVEREATEEQWEEMKPIAQEIGNLLREKSGPFFLGDTSKSAVRLCCFSTTCLCSHTDECAVSYADVIFVTYLKFLERLDADIFERYLALDPEFPKVYDACKEWLARED